jgi:post-segregation antitoxin (ccd killing protein)
MKSNVSSAARKRPVNLTLSEDLVEQAKAMTDNLSGVVENLLAEFLQKEQRALLTRIGSRVTCHSGEINRCSPK